MDELTEKEWILGNKEDKANFIILELNMYIHQKNWAEEKLELEEFVGRLKRLEKIERDIATRRNKIENHLWKWDQIGLS